MNKIMKVGSEVTLIPIEGGYQTPKVGVVVKVTKKRFVVKIKDGFRQITFLRSTGEPAFKNDKEFPKYQLEISS